MEFQVGERKRLLKRGEKAGDRREEKREKDKQNKRVLKFINGASSKLINGTRLYFLSLHPCLYFLSIHNNGALSLY